MGAKTIGYAKRAQSKTIGFREKGAKIEGGELRMKTERMRAKRPQSETTGFREKGVKMEGGSCE